MTFCFLTTTSSGLEFDVLEDELLIIDGDYCVVLVDGGVVIENQRFLGKFFSKMWLRLQVATHRYVSTVCFRQPRAIDDEAKFEDKRYVQFH